MVTDSIKFMIKICDYLCKSVDLLFSPLKLPNNPARIPRRHHLSRNILGNHTPRADGQPYETSKSCASTATLSPISTKPGPRVQSSTPDVWAMIGCGSQVKFSGK